jgi:hypothetical protein
MKLKGLMPGSEKAAARAATGPLASSTQLYDTHGHNDADIIDHIASVRYKSDRVGFSFVMQPDCHDDIVLKGAPITCPLSSSCTLGDHLLDGPHDNLSVLTMHVHRRKDLCLVPVDHARDAKPARGDSAEQFLTEQGPRAWIRHRLRLLLRLYTLNAFLAATAREFQRHTQGITLKGMTDTWTPPRTLFARAWPENKRDGHNIVKPGWLAEVYPDGAASKTDDGSRKLKKMRLVIVSTHTHPNMQLSAVLRSQLTGEKGTQG